MGKSVLSVKGKVFNAGLNSIVATSVPFSVATTIATTTSTAPVSPVASLTLAVYGTVEMQLEPFLAIIRR